MIEGYKDSPLGRIPKTWIISFLSEFTDEITDYVSAGSFANLKEKVTVLNEPNHAVYVRLTDLRKGLGHTEQKYIDEDSYKFLSKSNLYGREILFANIGANVGEVWIMPNIKQLASIAPNMILIRANNEKVNPEYLHAYLCSSIGLSQIYKIIAGSGHPKINKTELRKLLAILPPLPEQQKIAEILSTVDEKIEVIDQQITETQELKKGLMQRLLTKGIGHSEFKDSPLGKIPESWEVVKLEEIADVKGGKRLPKGETLSEEKTSHPYIRVADMFMGGVSLQKILYVPENIFPLIKNYTISKDDLFISVAGTLGIVGEIPAELDGANLTENADKLTNLKINKSYLLQVLLSPLVQNSVLKEQTNNAQPKLALTRIKTFEITKPPLEEQQKIAAILSSVDEKLEVLAEKKVNYQELKQGLMQQLLTGKIRVKV
ncbi:restriction endonuclease subunit S [Flavobacterium sp. 14A]|uniref:restriction endonuclease subunit S n=1 Tax=Flavobacterium sp. 14A TaxID=2735896 RepID=UPI00156E02BF|nr:restriction endonuclease subunit S [Flavobacterium sp. 14A]NRT12472.1 type I restriction enzyme S subunit [Flavobacterium sp. 14A]